MRRRVFSSLLPLLVLGLVACGGETKKTDTGTNPTPDAGTPVAPPPALTCGGDCKDYVVNKAIVPDTSTINTYGFIYEGKANNALGSILGLLAAQVPTLNLQETIDHSLNEGKVTILFELQAADFANDPKGKGQSWIGDAKTCCSTPDDKPACAAEAQTTCFNGTAEFTPSATSPKDATFWATITGGAFSGTAPTILLSLPIGEGKMELNLKQVQVKGKLVGDNIADGVIAGVIPSADIQTQLIPQVYKMIQDALDDPTVEESTKTTIRTLFDSPPSGNKDGTITEEEVKNNGIIKSFLKGDIDLDKDANHEKDHLSLGVGFTAVKAVIKK